MTRMAATAVSILAAVVCSGCASMGRQPSIGEAQIVPPDLRPGDTAIITVKVDDRFDIVKGVEGVIMEDRTITFKLRDDGIPPDQKAGDDVWTIQVDVPFNAPPGDFRFEVIGYDEAGEVIVVDDEAGEANPLSTTFGLVINYPEESSTVN